MSAHSVGRLLDQLLARMGIGQLGQDALLSTAGLGFRALIQGAYLIVLSRWMGVTGYGLFAGSVAAAVLVGPLSGWGIAYVLTRHVALDPSKSRALWATALLQVAVSGMLLLVAFMTLSSYALVDRVHLNSMLLLGLSELIALPLANVASSLCLALGRGGMAALSMCLVPLFRLTVVIVAVLDGIAGSPDHVAFLHFGGSILGVSAALVLISGMVGLPAWSARLPIVTAGSQGTKYAIGSMVGSSYQEVDKVLLLQILGATAAGNYTVAFRIMSVFLMPISALMGAALPRLFSHKGELVGSRILGAISFSAIGYAAIAGVIAMIVSPWMPRIFGEGFSESAGYLLMLSPWPVLYALHQTAAVGLTASDRQVARVGIEFSGLVLVAVVNLVLLESIGVTAAMVALLSAEILMACAGWYLLLRRRRAAELK